MRPVELRNFQGADPHPVEPDFEDNTIEVENMTEPADYIDPICVTPFIAHGLENEKENVDNYKIRNDFQVESPCDQEHIYQDVIDFECLRISNSSPVIYEQIKKTPVICICSEIPSTSTDCECLQSKDKNEINAPNASDHREEGTQQKQEIISNTESVMNRFKKVIDILLRQSNIQKPTKDSENVSIKNDEVDKKTLPHKKSMTSTTESINSSFVAGSRICSGRQAARIANHHLYNSTGDISEKNTPSDKSPRRKSTSTWFNTFLQRKEKSSSDSSSSDDEGSHESSLRSRPLESLQRMFRRNQVQDTLWTALPEGVGSTPGPSKRLRARSWTGRFSWDPVRSYMERPKSVILSVGAVKWRSVAQEEAVRVEDCGIESVAFDFFDESPAAAMERRRASSGDRGASSFSDIGSVGEKTGLCKFDSLGITALERRDI